MRLIKSIVILISDQKQMGHIIAYSAPEIKMSLSVMDTNML